MTNNDKNALELHKKFGGKITMALRDQEPMTREKLSAYYSPGVAAVSLAIEKDPVTYGCFTRAYIDVTLSASFGVNTVWSALSMTLMTDKSYSEKWDQWLTRRLSQHAVTDDSATLKILRYAADGAWFVESLSPKMQDDYEEIKQQLLLRTYPE